MSEAWQLAVDVTIETESNNTDLFISLPSSSSGRDLLDMLAQKLHEPIPRLIIERTGTQVDPGLPLSEFGLLSGDRLTTTARKQDTSSDALLRVLDGPHAGQVLAIGGTQTLGRRTNFLDHNSISRLHCTIELTPSGVAAQDEGSTNGTFVNGQQLPPHVLQQLNPGDRLELGSVVLELVSIPTTVSGRQSHLHYVEGHLEFNGLPRQLPPQPQTEFATPQAPEPPSKRRFPYAAAIIPLALGGAMAYWLSPIFALFMLMSPVMVAFNYIDDKRSGRTEYTEKRADFEHRLRTVELEVSDARDQFAAWLRRQTPDLTQLQLWTRTGAKEIWSRRPRDPDFLIVAPGVCNQPSGITVEVPEHGADELVEMSRRLRSHYDRIDDLPLAVDMGKVGVISVDGSSDRCIGVARGLVAQMAVLRSYRDLQIVVLAPGREHHWGWTKWLPHVRLNFDSKDKWIASNDQHTRQIFSELDDLQQRRQDFLDENVGAAPSTLGQHYFVVIHAPINVNKQALASFIEQGPRLGFSVLWVTDHGGGHHPDATVVIDDSRAADGIDVRRRDGSSFHSVVPRALSSIQATELARSLSPLIDARAGSATTELPRSVSLHDLLGEEHLTSDGLLAGWAAADATNEIRAVIGAGRDGPLFLDIKADGPHGLVAGTTGAGKSEFLQSVVGSLASSYSPTDLNFILIDYKGGSAFRECENLPHVIGFVTNLDDHLASRALISLRAELRRRETLFNEHAVGDLKEMRQRHPVAAPPSILIIIDEFAALKNEVPEFVDGLVDVAQRGRSMGVHMILATQKPGGVITPQIDANTNFRVALRVANDGESSDVIGSKDAAAIGTDTPGRGYLRIGGAGLTPFQSAYVGGHSSGAPQEDTRLLTTFDWDATGKTPVAKASGGIDGPSDLAMIVEQVRKAWHIVDEPPLHRPWLPTLADEIGLLPLLAPAQTAPEQLQFTVGVADYPERQAHEPFSLDVADAGNIAVYGVAGSGKTTLIRSLFAAVTAQSAPGSVATYAIDFNGGLATIDRLPAVGDVIAGNDMERIQLLLTMLADQVAERRNLLAQHRAGSFAELRGTMDDAPAYLIVAINGFGPFWSALENLGYGRHTERFERLFSDGKAVGIHFVLAAGQRGAIPHACMGSIGLRLLQRLTSKDEYHALDLQKAPSGEFMPPGRTLIPGGPEFQVAVCNNGDDYTGQGQAVALARLATTLRNSGYGFSAPRIHTLGDVVPIDDLPIAEALTAVAVGRTASLQPATLDLENVQTFLIAGRNGSGRTTALETLATQLEPCVASRRIISTLGKRPMRDEEGDLIVIRDDFQTALDSIKEEIAERSKTGWDRPIFIGIDDAELFFEDFATKEALDSLVNNARAAGVLVAMTSVASRISQNFDSWMRSMRSNGHGLILQPEGDREEDVFDVRFPRGTATDFPAGRGYLVSRGQPSVLHIAR